MGSLTKNRSSDNPETSWSCRRNRKGRPAWWASVSQAGVLSAAILLVASAAYGSSRPSMAYEPIRNSKRTTTTVPTTTTSTTAPVPTEAYSLWASTDRPINEDALDGNSVELGLKVRFDVGGWVTAVRFYKAPMNTGTHYGSLWTGTGTKLGSVTFINETASGWQQANFSAPIPVSAATTYVVSYFTPTGHFSRDGGYFSNSRSNGPVVGLASGTGGGNGVYQYGSPGFPTSTYEASNYWVDLVFSASGTTTTTTTTPTTTTTVPQSPSGQPMPVGDLPGWKQIFTDDFTTDVPLGSFPTAVSDKWDVYPDGWPDSSRNGTYYSSKVVSIKDGLLNKYLHTENGIHMVAALLPKLPGLASPYGQLYGRYTVRFRADALPGYKTAWLLWPDSEVWPRDGEIDFPEGNLDGTICGFVHHQDATSGSDQDGWCSTARYPSWHTATIEWSPERVTLILDGEVLGVSTTRIPNTPMHYVLQTETALNGVVPADSVAGNVQIDWVAIYKPA